MAYLTITKKLIGKRLTKHGADFDYMVLRATEALDGSAYVYGDYYKDGKLIRQTSPKQMNGIGYQDWMAYRGKVAKGERRFVTTKKTNTKTKSFNTFWILWQPNYPAPPRVQFYSKDEAVRAADRMAQEHKKLFYVLRAEESVSVGVPPLTREVAA